MISEREANERISVLLKEVRVSMTEIRSIAVEWDIRVTVDLGDFEDIQVNWDSSDAEDYNWSHSDQNC